MKFKYKVVASVSPRYKVGSVFYSNEKLHDGRRKTTILSDAKFRDFEIEECS